MGHTTTITQPLSKYHAGSRKAHSFPKQRDNPVVYALFRQGLHNPMILRLTPTKHLGPGARARRVIAAARFGLSAYYVSRLIISVIHLPEGNSWTACGPPVGCAIGAVRSHPQRARLPAHRDRHAIRKTAFATPANHKKRILPIRGMPMRFIIMS